MKEQEAKELLSSLGMETSFSKIPLVGPPLSEEQKMTEIGNKFLLEGDKFTSKMHLRKPGFTYSACGAFIKHKKRIQKTKETGDSRYINQN